MKQPIRFFSIGLLTSTLILLFVYLFSEESKPEIHLSIDDLIKQIEDEGYHVLSKSEYISFSVRKDQTAENITEEEQSDPSENVEQKENDLRDKDDETLSETKSNQTNKTGKKDKKQKEKVYTYKLVIEPNMLGSEIAELLVQKNIIEDAVKFNRFLEVEGYAKYIQLGEFELTSEMTHDQIAKTIAKKR